MKPDRISKLYFTFLSYTIPVVNKLNIIFQCKSPAIHKLHSNCSLAYKAIIGCFIKPVLLKGDVVLIYHAHAANHLPQTQLYMGVDASRLLASSSSEQGSMQDLVFATCFACLLITLLVFGVGYRIMLATQSQHEMNQYFI